MTKLTGIIVTRIDENQLTILACTGTREAPTAVLITLQPKEDEDCEIASFVNHLLDIDEVAQDYWNDNGSDVKTVPTQRELGVMKYNIIEAACDELVDNEITLEQLQAY